jgi:hypothetical protein
LDDDELFMTFFTSVLGLETPFSRLFDDDDEEKADEDTKHLKEGCPNISFLRLLKLVPTPGIVHICCLEKQKQWHTTTAGLVQDMMVFFFEAQPKISKKRMKHRLSKTRT